MGPSDRPLRGHRALVLSVCLAGSGPPPRSRHSPKPKIAPRFSSTSIQENRCTSDQAQYAIVGQIVWGNVGQVSPAHLVRILAGGRRACRHQLTIRLVTGSGNEQQIGFSPKASFAEYVELPTQGDQLRITLTNYSSSCDDFALTPADGILRRRRHAGWTNSDGRYVSLARFARQRQLCHRP